MTAHFVPPRGRLATPARSRRRRQAQRPRKLAFERLEARRLLAVSWDGGGGNSDWNNPLNWDSDNVPGSNDTAVIDLAGTFTVTLSTDVTVAGLTLGGTSGTQTLDTGDRTLTINGPATVTPHGSLLFGGTINGTLDNQGTLTVVHPVDVEAGGSGASSNSGTIQVQGGGFTMNLSIGQATFANTGTIDIGAGQTFTVSGAGGAFNQPGATFNQLAGRIQGPGTLNLETLPHFGSAPALTANFTTDFSNAETTLNVTGASGGVINGPGTFHFVRDQTLPSSPLDVSMTINAPIVNDAVLSLVAAQTTLGGPLTANPGSTLQVSGAVSLANGFTNHGLIELTSLPPRNFTGSLSVTNGTLVNPPEGIIRSETGNRGGGRGLGGSVDNQGLIEILEQDLSVGSLTTSGTVRIGAGRSLLVGVNLDIAASGSFGADGPASLTTNGLTGATHDPKILSNLAVTVNGDAVFEAMSEDRGPVLAGFDSNFAMIQLANAGGITLVDNADNAPGTGPEAVYADSVVIPAVTKLDLNGLHLYTRAASIAPTHVLILNGTIQIINDGGPIALNRFEPGNIGAAGERDEWTFFGRAGQTVTAAVKTGGSDPDAPFPPQIGFAQVELTDATQRLLGSATNTTEGDDAVLLNVALPADGVYSVFVSAPPGHEATNANYQIGVFDATAEEAHVVFHQPYLGQITNRFAVDRWTFSGVAGQNIRLDVLDQVTPPVQFALRGPNGSVFESVTADTIATLPASGEYELIVGGTQASSYRFQLDQVNPTELTLGTPFSGTLPAGGSAQLFRVPVTETQALSIVLDAASSAGHNELYAKIGSPPTRSDYQFASFTPGAVDQSVLVPAAPPGDWFILVYGEAVPQPASFTLLARGADIFVNSVTPHAVPSEVVVPMTDGIPPLDLVIEGSGFRDVTKVEILDNHGNPAAAQSIKVDSSQRIRATFLPTGNFVGGGNVVNRYFPFGGNELGPFSARVTNRDGSVGLLANAIDLLPATSGAPSDPFSHIVSLATLQTDLVLPDVLYTSGVTTLTVEYANTGILPMPAPILVLRLDDPEHPNLKPIMTLDPSIVPTGFLTSATAPDGFSDTIQVLASGRLPGVLEPGEKRQVPVYLVGFSGDIPFHEPLQFALDVIRADSNEFVVDWESAKDSLRPAAIGPEAWDAIFENFVGRVGTVAADYVQLLDSTAAYLSGIGEDVSDVHELFAFALAQADAIHTVKTLATTTDASVPAPGLDLELTRSFPNTITTRYRRGVLGRGWYHSWETSLTVESDGTVIVLAPDGGQRTFEPDRRPFRQTSYFAAPGDHGTLARLADGSFDLREADGTLDHYGSDGKLFFVEDPNGNRITATYTGDRLTRLEHSSGQFLDLAYNAAGLLQTVTDSDGRVVRYTYDPANEHLVQFEDFDGRITHYTYTDGTDIQQKHALATIEPPSAITRHFTYDDQGRYVSTFLNKGDERVNYTFGPGGEVTATDLTGAAYTSFLDQFGGVVRVDDALGHSISSGLSSDRNLTRFTDAIGQTYSLGYDTRGNVTSAVDPLGHTYSASYGALNRLRTFTDSKGNVTQYVYDERGNRIATTDALGVSNQVTYDPLGNPTSFTNGRGHVIATTYNGDGLLTGKSYADGTSVTFAYDDRARLMSTTDEHGPTTFEYDDGDRLTRVTYPGGRFLAYTYDPAGRRTQMVDQDGFTVKYLYNNPVGRLSELDDSTGAMIVKYTYDAVGRLARRDNANRTFTTYEYDGDSRVLHLVNHAPDGSVNSRFDYTYDTLGRRSSMSTLDGVWTYQYDAIGQLTHAAFASTNPGIPDQDLTYEYDAMGNRVRTIENGVETDYSTNALNEYIQVGSATYTYDADGNLFSIADGASTRTFTFDDEGRLVAVAADGSTTSYEYNALNDRIATVVDGTRTEFLNDPSGIVNLVAQFNGSGAVTAHYAHGLGLASRVDAAGTAAFYDFDAIGSTAGLTGADGTYVNQYRYVPFGAELGTTETIANPFQYVGKFGVQRQSNGLDFMRARYSSPDDGRFLSRDPMGILGGLNLFNYTMNDPVDRTDPRGRIPIQVGMTIFVDSELLSEEEIEAALFDFGQTTVETEALVVPESGEAIVGSALGLEIAAVAAAGAVGFGIGTLINDFIITPLTPHNYNLGDAIFDLTHPDDPDPDNFGPPPPGGPRRRSPAGFSIDPNSKTATAGFGPANFVAAGSVLPYRIDFENDPTATAPAQRVDVADQLSDKLDWNTFQFTEVAFGDQFLAIPPGSPFFHTVVDVNASSGVTDFQVAIDLDFNSATGQVTAQFQAIDPATGLPHSGLTGFLPPEDGSGRGQAHFSYMVRPVTGLGTDTEIRNVALIQFDFGEIINTNQVDPHDAAKGTDLSKEALVTIDGGPPSSRIQALPAVTGSTSFLVSWSGTDDAGGTLGSGIASYDVFVSDNGGVFTPFQTRTTQTSAPFAGQVGHTYAFYSVATDNVGHVEQTPTAAQASTLVQPAQATSFSAVSGRGTYAATATLSATLTAAGTPLAGKTVTFTLTVGGSTTMVGSATTDAQGVATLTGVSLAGVGAGSSAGAVGAGFAGDAGDLAAGAAGNLTVSPARATLALEGLAATYDGQSHLVRVTTDPPGLSGVTVTYTRDGVISNPTQAGSYAVMAALNNPNATAASVAGTLVINRATPTITWPDPADITTATPLGPAQLDAVATVPGSFTYTPAPGSVLNAGRRQALSATFTPSDPADYNAVTVMAHINVTPTAPSAPPVTVLGVQWQTRKLSKKKSTQVLVVSFSDALEPGPAANLADYHLVAPGNLKKRGKPAGKPVALASTVYNPALHTVSLTPKRTVPKQTLQLTITAAGTLDAAGRPIDGDRDGHPGGDFHANFGRAGIRLSRAAVPGPRAGIASRISPVAIDALFERADSPV